jgi:hypothetical protein
MTTYDCPKGHASTTDDFCDECGAKIGGTGSVSPPATAAQAPPAASGEPCPNCGCPRTGTMRFCEDCGFDFSTGRMPNMADPALTSPTLADPALTGTALPGSPGSTPPGSAPPGSTLSGAASPGSALSGQGLSDPPLSASVGSGPDFSGSMRSGAVAGQWTATVYADREYFAANAIEGVDFPADPPERFVTLPPPQVRIGRKSRSKGTDPEIDLADVDPGVSHSHALLTLSVEGMWLVSDLGSTNGTYLNDEQKPLAAGQTRSVGDGDRVHVGAWTTIHLHAPT